MLRVLVDATSVPADRGGVGRYVDNLLPALTGLGVTVRAVCQQRDAVHYSSLTGIEPLLAPTAIERRPVRLAWEQTGLPRAVARAAPDLLHCPHYTMPARRPVPTVVTLHDATFFTDPELHTRTKGPFFRAATRLALRRATGCVVDSQATADELIRVAGASPDRMQVAHLGVDTSVFAPPDETRRPPSARASDWPTGRSTSPSSALSNRARTCPPWCGPGSRRAATGPTRPRSSWPAAPAGITTSMQRSPRCRRHLALIRPGYLPVEQLAGLLGGATLVAYPSLGEGFGLPVLEAMACGAAVLTTRRLAIPEVGGDAVAYAKPTAPALAAALVELLDDPARRAQLAAAGLARSAGFSWRACAEAHVLAYEAALRRAGARHG